MSHNVQSVSAGQCYISRLAAGLVAGLAGRRHDRCRHAHPPFIISVQWSRESRQVQQCVRLRMQGLAARSWPDTCSSIAGAKDAVDVRMLRVLHLN